MKNFKSGGNFSRKDSESRGFNQRGGNSPRPMMFSAVCAECGQSCKVPFRPSGDKPVFCSNCFKGKDRPDSNRTGGRNFARPNFQDKKMFRAVCAECGQSCEVPFRPSGDKPVYCSSCFGHVGSGRSEKTDHGVGTDQIEKHFLIINQKLDKILQGMSFPVREKAAVEKRPRFRPEAKTFKPSVKNKISRPKDAKRKSKKK